MATASAHMLLDQPVSAEWNLKRVEEEIEFRVDLPGYRITGTIESVGEKGDWWIAKVSTIRALSTGDPDESAILLSAASVGRLYLTIWTGNADTPYLANLSIMTARDVAEKLKQAATT